MNHTYQGKVTNAAIANPDQHTPRILSASTALPRPREGERGVEDPVRVVGEEPITVERTEVRCRNQSRWLPFTDDPKQTRWVAQATRLSRPATRRTLCPIDHWPLIIGCLPQAHAHQLFQNAVIPFSALGRRWPQAG